MSTKTLTYTNANGSKFTVDISFNGMNAVTGLLQFTLVVTDVHGGDEDQLFKTHAVDETKLKALYARKAA